MEVVYFVPLMLHFDFRIRKNKNGILVVFVILPQVLNTYLKKYYVINKGTKRHDVTKFDVYYNRLPIYVLDYFLSARTESWNLFFSLSTTKPISNFYSYSLTFQTRLKSDYYCPLSRCLMNYWLPILMMFYVICSPVIKLKVIQDEVGIQMWLFYYTSWLYRNIKIIYRTHPFNKIIETVKKGS